MPIRVLIVDDEAPAREKLRRLLAAEPDVEVVAEAADGEEAVAAIARSSSGGEGALDLVFLDVRMPKLDGFGVIHRVHDEAGPDAMPPVVFVTAFDQHALRAFEVHALDYLLKPFAPARLGKVLDRVRKRQKGGSSAELARRMERLLAALEGEDASPGPESTGEPERLTRLRVDAGPEREVLLPVEEIDWVRADANYLEVHARGRAFRRRGTLTDLASRLEPEVFLRINRSELVRLDAVAELQPWFHGDYKVILKSGEQLTWSRRYRAKEKARFE
jgi:two-component system LytT family response regulator